VGTATPTTPGSTGRRSRGRGHGRRTWFVVLGVVAVVAAASRLVPLLRGGGLWGLAGYDGGVYYAAAAGLAHGQVPYADHLLPHPPGICSRCCPSGWSAACWATPTGRRSPGWRGWAWAR